MTKDQYRSKKGGNGTAMTCPDCGYKLRIEHAISAPNYKVYRRRVCPSCTKSVYTLEVPVKPEEEEEFRRMMYKSGHMNG